MSFTVFLGNLPTWVTADDIMGWLTAENLVADAIKVIRNPETQESKGFAFIEAPNNEEMNSIIRRFDRAPLEDRLLRANPRSLRGPRVRVPADLRVPVRTAGLLRLLPAVEPRAAIAPRVAHRAARSPLQGAPETIRRAPSRKSSRRLSDGDWVPLLLVAALYPASNTDHRN